MSSLRLECLVNGDGWGLPNHWVAPFATVARRGNGGIVTRQARRHTFGFDLHLLVVAVHGRLDRG